MNRLNEQGQKIVAAIQAGIAAMTPARWQEENEKAAQYEESESGTGYPMRDTDW